MVADKVWCCGSAGIPGQVGRDLHQQLCHGMTAATVVPQLFAVVGRLHVDLPPAARAVLVGWNLYRGFPAPGVSRRLFAGSARGGKTRARAFPDNYSWAGFCSWFVSILYQCTKGGHPGDASRGKHRWFQTCLSRRFVSGGCTKITFAFKGGCGLAAMARMTASRR